MAAAVLGGFFHYTRIGPNEVSEEDEREAAKAAGESQGGSQEVHHERE